MPTLSVLIDHKKTDVMAVERDGEVYVALDDFCALVNAEAKTLEANGPLAVCRDDLCIPLNVSNDADTLTLDGVLMGRLEAFAEPLGLSSKLEGQVLKVTSGKNIEGLGIGHTPPAFTLPDLYSGEAVALSDYRGKKTVFYMWASWWGCRGQLPGWQSFYEEYKDDVNVVVIAQDAQGADVAKPWVEKAGGTYRALLDQNNVIGKAYHLKYVPVGILVDEEGRLARAVGSVNIDQDEFRAELTDWVTTGVIPKAWIDADKGSQPTMLTAEEREADARFQLAIVLLENGKKEEAIAELKHAFRLDPENWLIRKQLWAIETPEAFYDGNVDYGWQKAQMARENAALKAKE